MAQIHFVSWLDFLDLQGNSEEIFGSVIRADAKRRGLIADDPFGAFNRLFFRAFHVEFNEICL